MKGKWSAGKVAALACGCIAAGVTLIISFYISIWQFNRNILEANIKNGRYQQYDYNDSNEDDVRDEENSSREGSRSSRENERDRNAGEDRSGSRDFYDRESNNSEYYEFHDELREDLFYWGEFETYEETFGENSNVFFSIVYPIFYNDEGIDFTGVNNAIQKELNLLQDYAESVTEWVGDEDTFLFEAESYVTYMDEDVLSIAYVERGYLNGDYYESYVVSVNVDMDSRMMLTNSHLLDIDDEFSIEFRNRCEKQNGEIRSLDYYSDQDITEMLNSEDELILFYTPIGMEVGFNYYNGWVTVTYPDYLKYQKKF